ncbi:MAG TPA: SUMF1/EgtB/PvdO family nonheme iron enzyme [Chitinophagaceae bacterium]|nr:SUMF1/EgtB/PvdO family nonheme iron enzyme [Chitinophagaceae bacterium]
MKRLFFLSLVALSIHAAAQQSAEPFAPYEQTVPGATLRFTMVPIKEGSFLMGSKADEPGRNKDEGPQKKVRIDAFWMAAFEVSRDAFDVFYKDEATPQNSAVDAVTRPSQQYIDFSLGMGKEGGYPVNSMSQYAALMYCRWLYSKTGIFYRLPSEAEWEYACRAGSNTRYFFGDDSSQLDKYAWYAANSGDKFQKSGQKLPNAWGLYDMLGNVSEWTLDHYDPQSLEKLKDDIANPFAAVVVARYPKVLKGGNYADGAQQLRVAARLPSDPIWNRRDPQIPRSKWWITDAPWIGFRVIRPKQQPTREEADAFYKKYLGQ